MPLRPVRGMANFAVVALICVSLTGVVAAVIDLWFASLVDRMIADPDSVPDAEIDTGDLVWGLSGIAETAAFILAGVAFLVWLFRVRANAEVLSPDYHRRKRPWLIFGWVVPVVSLWFPKQIVDDIWHASSRTPRPPSGLFHAWWAAWLISTWVARAVSRMFRADDPETVANAARFDVASNVLLLVAAALAIGVIRKITTAQEEHRSAIPGVPLAGMPPAAVPPAAPGAAHPR